MGKTVSIKDHGYYVNTKTNVYHDPSQRFPKAQTRCPMLQWLEYGKFNQAQADNYEWVAQEPVGPEFSACGRCP